MLGNNLQRSRNFYLIGKRQKSKVYGPIGDWVECPERDSGFEEVPRVPKALLSLHWVILLGVPIGKGFHYCMLIGSQLTEIAGSLGDSPILLRGSAPSSASSGWKIATNWKV